MCWSKEEIPNSDGLLLRVHKQYVDNDGEPNLGAFSPKPDGAPGLSVNWEKYATAEETRQAAHRPHLNGVVRLITGDVRFIPNTAVEHEPVCDNRAHSEIVVSSPEDDEHRLKLKRRAAWVIGPP